MASITTMRQALATNLATVPGLRTNSVIPEDPKPPIAIVTFERVDFDTSMGRALDTYLFRVIVIVGRVDTRGAQTALDGYLSGTGTNSLKAAIESDRTLGGEANDLRVTSGDNLRELAVGEITYVAADLSITVYA
jgi:hypothetical protein